MAHRAPRYSYLHAARDVGAAAISVSHTADPAYPKNNLIDDRANGTLFKWNASYSTPYIDVDLLSGFATGIDRLIIPANHNLTYVRVGEDSSSGFGAIDYRCANTQVFPGTLIDIALTPSTKQYLRLYVNATGLFYLSQLIYTIVETLSAGPNLRRSRDSKLANETQLVQPSGIRPTVQHGPQQRVIDYDYTSPLEGTDLTKMEALIAYVGLRRPFYVDPTSFSTPPEDDEPALAMKFPTMPEGLNSILVPENGTRSKTYKLPLIESVD